MLMEDRPEFSITYNRNKFHYISPMKTGLLAWEKIGEDKYEGRIVPVNLIKDGETFLKMLGLWERYEKDYNNAPKDEINVNLEKTVIRTEEVLESTNTMTKIKVDTPISKEVMNSLNDTLQIEIKRGRGRPKGSKNIKKG